MHKAEINPIRRVEPISDSSLLTIGDTIASNKNILVHRIELLQLQNTALRQREQYLKMVNAALLKALNDKDGYSKMIDRHALELNINFRENENPEQIDHSNKMNSFKKKSKQRKIDLQEAHRRSVETVYDPGDIDLDLSSKKFQVFDDDDTFGEDETQSPNKIQVYSKLRKSIVTSKQRQKTFSKTKSPSFFKTNKQHSQQSFSHHQCYTPKVQPKKLVNFQNSSRKSVNNLMQPLHLQSSFSKKDIYLSCSSRSQKSPLSNHSNIKNIATGLLCDLCGMSYSPVEFMSHAKQCQQNYLNGENKLIKITDKSYEEDESQGDDEEDLLNTLEKEKRALLSQISRLKKSRRESPVKKLEQPELDQIVFIIKNQKLKQQQQQSVERSMSNLLKEKNKIVSGIRNKKRDRI